MKRKLIHFATIVLAGIFIYSSIMLISQYAASKKSVRAFERIAALVEPTVSSEAGNLPQSSQDTSQETSPVFTASDKYAQVYEQNQDFIGWLRIDGTSINYPVMQSPSAPDFYLKHAFDRSDSAHGTPYVQGNCIVGVSDNLVIHGHNMNDGTMFADLCGYEDESFYASHQIIHFDTMDGFGEYEVLAAFKTVSGTEEKFPYQNFVSAASAEDFADFIANCKARCPYDTGVSAHWGDKLITLSTCEYSRPNGRMVVVAKLLPQGNPAPKPNQTSFHKR